MNTRVKEFKLKQSEVQYTVIAAVIPHIKIHVFIFIINFNLDTLHMSQIS
jgi:hypothetical protein